MRRTLALFRAHWQATWGRGAWPVAPLVMHGSGAAVLCLLLRDALPPFAYALAALSAAAALLALPLLGEFAPLLRADPAREWVEALPAQPIERRVARALLALTLVLALAASTGLPIALLAPDGVGLAARALLLAAALAQALFVAATLLALQSVLGGRAEGLLVGAQTLLVAAVLGGALLGLRELPRLVPLVEPADAWLAWPPAWFAAVSAPSAAGAWKLVAPLATLLALAALLLVPPAPPSTARRAGLLSVLTRPLCALAARTWVRREERGSFALVCAALPLEREFVLRTYPLLGLPLALLFAGARSGSGIERDGLLALLLFTPATWLPVLLVQVPASASGGARWLLESAPLSRGSIDNGALKALAVRFLLPLYALLAALAASQAGLEFALRLAPAGFLVTLLVLRRLYPLCVRELPLSVAPEALAVELDWTGTLLGLALVLVVLAVLALKFLTSLPLALAACALLLLLEWHADRAAAHA